MIGKRISLLGVNHKTTPLAVREKLALAGGYEEPLLALKKVPGCSEHFLLSTCNRVELLFVSEPSSGLDDGMMQFLFGESVNCRAAKPLFISLS